MLIHDITGGGSLELHVREFGRLDGQPIVFVHGWSQHHISWARQIDSTLAESFRLIVFDLRGHGASEAPRGRENYTNGAFWAEDLRAIIAELSLQRPIIVANSYGGLVLGDYLRLHGDGSLGGIVFAGATLVIGQPFFRTHIGSSFTDLAPLGTSQDQPTMLRGMVDFVRACTAHPLPEREAALLVASNMLTRPDVRRALSARTEDFRDLAATLTVPVLVAHGRADRIILPRMAQDILERCPHAQASWYDACGHLPFAEAPDRFNDELAAFAEHARIDI